MKSGKRFMYVKNERYTGFQLRKLPMHYYDSNRNFERLKRATENVIAACYMWVPFLLLYSIYQFPQILSKSCSFHCFTILFCSGVILEMQPFKYTGYTLGNYDLCKDIVNLKYDRYFIISWIFISYASFQNRCFYSPCNKLFESAH